MTETNNKSTTITIDKLTPFEGHPFKVIDNEEMNELVTSIQTLGILDPLIVKSIENTQERYEIISGHRRYRAALKAGIKQIPALIIPMSRDEAAIALVDSNLHRDHILPSERAFSYKLKLEALKHQGTSVQLGPKLTASTIEEGKSASQVKRYIRLTNLIPEILDMVDSGKIALTPAVEISYLSNEEQEALLDVMDFEDCTPSLSQAVKLKKLSQSQELTKDGIFDIMSQLKANQKEKIKIPTERVRKFFPKNYTAAQMEEEIIKMCESRYRKRQRNRDER